jgi:vanillate O-demethylase monooxygenase subunit
MSERVDLKAMGLAPAPQPFVTNCWYVAAWSHELAPGTVIGRRLLGTAVALFRTDAGRIGAMRDLCPHRFAPLSMGKVVGEGLQCPYHGLEFAADGRCRYNPHGDGATPAALDVATYPLVERYHALWIWMGDAPADPALIPDMPFIAAAKRVHLSAFDYLHVAANWRSITDNLLDLSHGSFVHAGLLGNADTAAQDPRVETDGDRVTVHRDPVETDTLRQFAPILREPRARSMKWNAIHWVSPAVMIVDSGVCAPDEDMALGTGICGLHWLTPETDRTTHYFFTSVRTNPLTDPERDAGIAQAISQNRRYAFAVQDAPIIEAQQRALDELGPSARPALLKSIDEGAIRVQRIVDRLLAAERAPDLPAARAPTSHRTTTGKSGHEIKAL